MFLDSFWTPLQGQVENFASLATFMLFKFPHSAPKPKHSMEFDDWQTGEKTRWTEWTELRGILSIHNNSWV
ncbi:hypothetical protein D082_12510 [Synechocystis sp. PCC 6714]|nr:hypothetical protein D082_12510 [Synechocystis sp. PCC 6714]